MPRRRGLILPALIGAMALAADLGITRAEDSHVSEEQRI